MIEKIRIDLVGQDTDLQMRDAGVDVGIVAEYSEALNDGATFPPITLFFDGKRYWLADGFHRHAAAKKVGREFIDSDVRQGTRRDAMLHAVGVNAVHGIRRTAADKRRAITAMLRDPDWAKWSDRQIGKQCSVDGKTVAKIRAELTADFRTERCYANKHGSISTLKVALPPTDPVQGSMVARMLAKTETEALIAECHRRGLRVVTDAN